MHTFLMATLLLAPAVASERVQYVISQLVEKGFAVMKEGAPNVFRIKVYGAQKGGPVSYTRFTGIVVDGVAATGKTVFTYDAGVLYESLSNRRQEELIRDKIAPSLVNIINAAFDRTLIQ